MSRKEVQKELEKEFINKWKDQARIAYQNQDLKVNKEVKPEEALSPWVRFSVLMGAGEQVAMGSAAVQYRYVGVIAVQVFTAEGTGAQTNRDICDDVADIFRSKQIDSQNISCQTPDIVEVGTDGGWWQVNVEIPFYWDEFTNP